MGPVLLGLAKEQNKCIAPVTLLSTLLPQALQIALTQSGAFCCKRFLKDNMVFPSFHSSGCHDNFFVMFASHNFVSLSI